MLTTHADVPLISDLVPTLPNRSRGSISHRPIPHCLAYLPHCLGLCTLWRTFFLYIPVDTRSYSSLPPTTTIFAIPFPSYHPLRTVAFTIGVCSRSFLRDLVNPHQCWPLSEESCLSKTSVEDVFKKNRWPSLDEFRPCLKMSR